MQSYSIITTTFQVFGATREKDREELGWKSTTAQLADLIGITPKGAEWEINRLKKDGLLKRLGPTKDGRWIIIE